MAELGRRTCLRNKRETVKVRVLYSRPETMTISLIGGTGRRSTLKTCRLLNGRTGSNPVWATKRIMDKKYEQQLSYKEWEKRQNSYIQFLKEKANRLWATRDSFNLMLRIGLKKVKKDVPAQARRRTNLQKVSQAVS